jgi:hypothetical protein
MDHKPMKNKRKNAGAIAAIDFQWCWRLTHEPGCLRPRVTPGEEFHLEQCDH